VNRCVILLVAAACGDPLAAPAKAPDPCAVERASLGAGLVHERWSLGATPVAGSPACVDVVRVDPARHAMRVLSDAKRRTAPAWRDAEKLVAVINAGMFHDDGAPVGLTIAGGRVLGIDNPKFGGFVAWDPVAAGDPPVMVTGSQCAGFDLAALRARYRSLVQSYRLLDCDGRALPWSDPKHYSAAAIGVDRSGRVVLLHARAAVTMAELSRALATHDLAGAIFLEGGPEATLIAGELERIGSYETGFVENDDNHEFWALPNVIGFTVR